MNNPTVGIAYAQRTGGLRCQLLDDVAAMSRAPALRSLLDARACGKDFEVAVGSVSVRVGTLASRILDEDLNLRLRSGRGPQEAAYASTRATTQVRGRLSDFCGVQRRRALGWIWHQFKHVRYTCPDASTRFLAEGVPCTTERGKARDGTRHRRVPSRASQKKEMGMGADKE